jgi:6-phosphogluconate dehydrogenase
MNNGDIAVVGLGVMGQNLALNIESRGFSVVGYDTDMQKATDYKNKKANGKKIEIAESLDSMVQQLAIPRKVFMMVPAGKPVDETIDRITPLLSSGDVLIDGGNSNFKDTNRRVAEAESKGLLYIGTGVSGGEEGALKGPSIMPGGSLKAWPVVKPILTAIAAKTEDGDVCCDWVGLGGAGHFVKMVHNGIEYADMQLICEAYFLMERTLGMSATEMHDAFAEWNQGELQSYLIEITRDILTKVDPDTGKPIIDVIKDRAGQKGTGKWTSQTALDLGVAAPTIGEAVFARCLSAIKTERLAASSQLIGPQTKFEGDKKAFVGAIRDSLYASKICSYAQGFQMMQEASREYGWQLDFGAISKLWRAGCIIRARFLDPIREAYATIPELRNLMLAPYFRDAMVRCQSGWREVVSQSALLGISIPAFSSALAYYDGYRSERLPANLLQAQRDYFGAHTYERLDKPGAFHTDWS